MTTISDLVLVTPPTKSGSPLYIRFNELSFPRKLNLALLRALAATQGQNAADTQRKAFQALKLFSSCLDEKNIARRLPVAPDALQLFASWLNDSDRGPSAQTHLRSVAKLLSWCQRNTEGLIASNANLIVQRIRRYELKRRNVILDETTLKNILRACYQEIELAERQAVLSKQLVEGTLSDQKYVKISALIRELLVLGEGELPKQELVRRSSKNLARRVQELGGHKKIAEMLFLTPAEMFPFYLAILIQTSGNPDAIKQLSRKCIVPHPLRTDLECLVWPKRRSAREQRVDFPVGRRWSATSLVRRLLVLNENLISQCPKSIADRLFICHVPARHRISVLAPDIFQKELKAFVCRNKLPPFFLKDVRRAGAVAHHKAAGTIVAAKNRLNHVSLQTTARYTSLTDRAEEHERAIRRFQGEMVHLSLSLTEKKESRTKSIARASEVGADTTFGFRCRDPLEGIGPGSVKGSPCTQFFRCATCPGAIVPLDDPIVVARLLASLKSLEEARTRAIAEGWWPRYELIYEPTREVLAQQLLPSVHNAIKEVASALELQRLIPPLE